ERLLCLQQRVPALEVVERERKPRERGKDQAVVRRRLAEDPERPLAPERLPEQPVDELVGRDPRSRDPAAPPRPQRRRGENEGREREPRTPGSGPPHRREHARRPGAPVRLPAHRPPPLV